MEAWWRRGGHKGHASLKFQKDGSLAKCTSCAPNFFPLWRNPPLSHLGRYYYLCHDELSCPSPAREYTPRPSQRPPPPRLRTLPSDKQIITPLYEAECTSMVHLVHNLCAHPRANSALVAQVEEILWDPNTGDFAPSYANGHHSSAGRA